MEDTKDILVDVKKIHMMVTNAVEKYLNKAKIDVCMAKTCEYNSFCDCYLGKTLINDDTKCMNYKEKKEE